MRLQRRVEMIFGQPYHILPSHWHSMQAEFAQEIKAGVYVQFKESEYVEARAQRPLVDCNGDPIPQMEMTEANSAIIPVSGVLVKTATGSEKYYYNVRPYEDIAEDIDNALAADAQAIGLLFNSPGGSVVGCSETAKYISDVSERIPVIAYTSDCMASAAMYLAAGASEIYASPTAIVGSIGTMWEIINMADFLRSIGIDWQVFTSGALKAVGHPAKEMSLDHAIWVQNFVDMFGGQFRDWMREKRGMKDKDMEGQVFIGSDGEKNGLVDGLMSERQFKELVDERASS